MQRWLVAWCCTLLYAGGVHAEGRYLSIIVRGNLTTGSQLFPTPASTDEVERAFSEQIDNSFGVGAEIRYTLPETQVAIGLGTEYIRTTSSFQRPITPSSSRFVPVDDGYRVIPVELTGYFLIPVSGPTFSIYMGGGVGMYFGERVYSFAGVNAPSVSSGKGFGIHVLGGVSFALREWVAIQAEMKFRDLQFESSNAFTVTEASYNGFTIPLSRQSFVSRVNTNGIVFQVGLAFSL